MPAQRNRVRIREVVFAVAMGTLAAGGAAIMIDAMHDDNAMEDASSGPSELNYPVMPFEKISTIGPQDVVVTYGEAFTVRSEGSAEELGGLEAVVKDGKLTIQPKDGNMFGFDWMRRSSATFYVTLPRLEAFTLFGTGDARIDRIEGERFEASIRGPGELSIGAMKVDKAIFAVAGPGNIEATGTAGDTRVSLTGPGEIDASALRSKTAWVSMEGSGDASLTVDNEAQVSIKGSGDVDISGPARCTVTRMGSGDVRCSGGDGEED